MSRNEREGRYIGYWKPRYAAKGRHRRVSKAHQERSSMFLDVSASCAYLSDLENASDHLEGLSTWIYKVKKWPSSTAMRKP